MSPRIDNLTKQRASIEPKAMSLSVSNTMRWLKLKTATEERCLPFEGKTPNLTTLNAMKELENRKGVSFNNLKSLMDDLSKED